MAKAAAILRAGGLVAFPTETVYGLGANGLDPEAVAKIFKAKGRPQDNPLILHLSHPKQVYELAKEVPPMAERLMAEFWPGPLTLVLKRSELVSDLVTGGLDTVALRMPSHPIALALVAAAGIPIAAPSANLSGKPSPTSASHVMRDLNGRIQMILDGGSTTIGLESTVLDLTTVPPTLLRPGGIDLEALQGVLGQVSEHSSLSSAAGEVVVAIAPGMKYQHYSPEAKVVLVVGKQDAVWIKMAELARGWKSDGKKVGAMTLRPDGLGEADVHKYAGLDASAVARNLFRIFREFNQENVDVIMVEGIEGDGLGRAIMNRLRKASFQVIEV
ncbi:UNVERIFIED_CONTAM: hypothetical protein GTU68_061097 [Idotea baltica]|nr:hypothetical protein [Idotea baltica]